MYATKNKVAQDIASGTHQYFVQESAPAVDVQIVLRSHADATNRNNLDNLPSCKRAT
jgi:hypothetical protein